MLRFLGSVIVGIWPLFIKTHDRLPLLCFRIMVWRFRHFINTACSLYPAKLSERFWLRYKMRPQYRYYFLALIFLFYRWLAQLLVLIGCNLRQRTFKLAQFPLFSANGLLRTLPLELLLAWLSPALLSWLVAERNG